MTTTSASPAAPKPVEAAHKPNQPSARTDGQKSADAPADLFAAMLAMLSDGNAAPSSSEEPLSETDTATTAADGDATTTDANPLAAMLAWMAPAQAAADTGDNVRNAARDASTTKSDGKRQEGIDIEGMTRVDEAAPALPNAAAQARAASASRPAFSPLNPNAPANTVASAVRAQEAQASGGSAPAMVWQRGAPSGTDALQQQQSAQLAQVRSTVALNERFGLAGAPPELNAAAPSQREFTTTVAGSGAVSGPAASTDTGVAGLVGAGSSGDAGGSNGEHATDTQTSDGQPQHHTEAGAETEGPTVSHWGTQHLRHASLRVGEGSADAIDIQLQVQGQEVQVAFQTDNAEARAQLRDNAGASLADLMQRSGIQLGNVSVGSQGQQPGGDGQPRSDAGPRMASLGRAGAAAEPASRPLPQQPLRSDGSRPLDVFA